MEPGRFVEIPKTWNHLVPFENSFVAFIQNKVHGTHLAFSIRRDYKVSNSEAGKSLGRKVHSSTLWEYPNFTSFQTFCLY